MNTFLQSPVIYRAGFAMGIGDIYLGNLRIMADHIQRTMPEQPLQGEHIPAGPQISYRKGMPEFMRMDMRNLSPFSQAADQYSQAVAVEGAVSAADKKRSFKIITILPQGNITPDSFSGGFSQVGCATFSAFGSPADPVANIHFASLEVHIFDGSANRVQ